MKPMPLLKSLRQPLSQACGGWPLLHWVAGIALLLRLLVAFGSEQIWHPDEVFQYLEQGHRLAFGYGTIPWEYRYGIRSWLLPGLIAGVLAICQRLGLGDPHFYIPLIQGLTCLVSLVLVYCAYWLGRQLVSEAVGRVAAVLTALWHELLIVAHKPTPEIFGAYLLVLALTLIVVKGQRGSAVLAGVCCATAVALRLQYAPVALVLIGAASYYWRWKQIAIALLSGLAVIAAAGALDAYTWGFPFASYYHNYLYNKVYGVSLLWGRQPLWTYPLLLAFNSGGVFLGAIAYSLIRKPPKPWLLMAMVASVVIPHTLIGHKEYRFIFVAIPLCLLLTAILLVDLAQRFSQRQSWLRFLVGYLTVCSIAGVLVNTRLLSRSDTLQASLYLNDAPRVESVLNLHSVWFNAGGYYYLHRDVPLYFAEHLPEQPIDFADHFSHIIVKSNHAPIPGFEPIAQFDSATVLANHQDGPYQLIETDPRIPLQGGVDGIYEPRITPRF
ncbi:hypothetical protein C7271_02355 [filamentous cyanobacterium CCP5]|nr:hypothetical protein C7271_02355 [filamentous cyanobacterium CCP5]